MLNPGQTKGVTYQISNPQDLGTLYYVKCVVRNSVTLATIATLNLVSKGSGLYVGSYQVPQDSTGVGYELFETVSVYTDSGYSSLSPNYSIVNTPYDVRFQLSSGTFGGANAGGFGIDRTDYNYIKQIIEELLEAKLSALPKPEKFSTAKLEESSRRLALDLMSGMKVHREEIMKMFDGHKSETKKHFNDIRGSIGMVGDSVGKIPLHEAVDEIKSELFDLKQLHQAHDARIGQVIKDQSEHRKENGKRHEDLKSEMNDRFDNHLKETANTLSDYFGSVDTMIVNKGIPKPERQAEKQYDFLADVTKYNMLNTKKR